MPTRSFSIEDIGMRTVLDHASPGPVPTAASLYTSDFLNPETGAAATLLTNSADNKSRHVAMLFTWSSTVAFS